MPPQQNPLTSDCVACWRLNESSGGSDAIDITSNGHDGALWGTMDAYTGVFDGARRHSGGNGAFTIASPSDLKLQLFTVVGWFTMIDDPQDDGGSFYLVKWTSGGVGTCLKIGDISAATDSVRFGAQLCMDHATAKYVTAYSSQNYFAEMGVWNHIAVVWDGTYLWLYINGRPHCKEKNTTGISTIPYDSASITIGEIAYYQDGAICDFAVYDTAKNENWVYYQYTGSTLPSEPNGLLPTDDALLLYRMDEQEPGECARDATGHSYYASLPAGSPPFPASSVDGYVNEARDLSATGTLFSLYDVPSLYIDTLTAISVCKPLLGNSTMFAKLRSGGYSWRLYFLSSGGKLYPRFSVTLSGGTVTATSTIEIAINEWHVLVGTFDGFYVKIYCDGSLLKETQNTTGTTDIVYDTTKFSIAESGTALGCTDEVALYGYAVDDDWVADHVDPPFGDGTFYILDARIIAHDTLRIKFSEPVSIDENFLDPTSWVISTLTEGATAIRVVKTMGVLSGETATSLVDLHVTKGTKGAGYQLNINKIKDVTGERPFTTVVGPFVYQLTKVDEILSSVPSMYGKTLEANLRQVLSAIAIQDEEIGGPILNVPTAITPEEE